MSEFTALMPDAKIDLRGTPCPLNFVRTKLKLQQMQPGLLLEVWLDPGEPIEQVPDSLVMAGYEIERLEDKTDFFVLQVRALDTSQTIGAQRSPSSTPSP